MKLIWKINICITVVMVLVTFVPAQKRQAAYRTYNNQRFEYSISYPTNFLFPQEIAANGDGRKFLSRDGRTIMWVAGQENGEKKTLVQLYREKTDASQEVTYKLLKRNWFVVSGLQNGNVFYEKTIYRNDEFLTFRIEYPKSQKRLFDPITAVIAKSFR